MATKPKTGPIIVALLFAATLTVACADGGAPTTSAEPAVEASICGDLGSGEHPRLLDLAWEMVRHSVFSTTDTPEQNVEAVVGTYQLLVARLC